MNTNEHTNQWTTLYKTFAQDTHLTVLMDVFIKRYFNFTNKKQSLLATSIIKKVKQMAFSNQPDYDIYMYIYNAIINTNTPLTEHEEYINNIGRANARAIEICSILKISEYTTPIKTYLDIGCSDGYISSALKQHLGLTAENTYGCDILEPKQIINIHNNFNYVQLFSEIDDIVIFDKNPEMEQKPKTFDLITCLMSLHHIKNPNIFRNIYNLLNDDGLLLIREHDIKMTDNNKLFLDIMHGLYNISFPKSNNTQENITHCDTFYAEYKTKDEWTKLICNAGFKRIQNQKLNEKYNMSNIKREYNPNKSIKNIQFAYYAVYQKIN